MGVTLGAAFGDFTGGRLRCWRHDDGVQPLVACIDDHAELLDLRFPKVFHGGRVHEVEAFEGERYSVIYFTCSGRKRASDVEISHLATMGIWLPSERHVRLAESIYEQTVLSSDWAVPKAPDATTDDALALAEPTLVSDTRLEDLAAVVLLGAQAPADVLLVTGSWWLRRWRCGVLTRADVELGGSTLATVMDVGGGNNCSDDEVPLTTSCVCVTSAAKNASVAMTDDTPVAWPDID